MQFWQMAIIAQGVALVACLIALYFNIQAGRHIRQARRELAKALQAMRD